MRHSDVDRRSVDSSEVVDHEVALAMANDVEHAADLSLKVCYFVAGMEVDNPNGLLAVSRTTRASMLQGRRSAAHRSATNAR
jgi:hypothetical protein